MKKCFLWLSVVVFGIFTVAILTKSIHITGFQRQTGQAAEKSKQEDVYYLNLSYYKLWESGDYNIDDGMKYENYRRLRYPDTMKAIYSEYDVKVSADYCLSFFEYDKDMRFVKATDLIGETKFIPEKETEYFKVSLFRTFSEKSLSPGQWNKLFPDMEIIISHGDLDKFLEKQNGSLIHSTGEMTKGEVLMNSLFLDEGEQLANQLWNNQILTGEYTITGDELQNKNLTMYFSSSEGKDENSGLSPEYPKKTLELYSGNTNINMLLKCGDVFNMLEGGFWLGSNSVCAAYGEGPRPILNFYLELDVTFKNVNGLKNVWVADLSKMDICNIDYGKTNCNIGQLVINGEVNWKRKVWKSSQMYDPASLVDAADGSWAADWHTSNLYLYSEKDPNELEIQYAPPCHGINLKNAKNVVLKGVEITGTGCHGINIKDSENVVVSNCYFHHIGGSIHRSAGVRYGNAVQVWDSAKSITISNNYADWVFDTCYTNQGSSITAYEENVLFERNIGSHCLWGLEIWGDDYSDNSFGKVEYRENLIYATMDITCPGMPMYSSKRGKVVFADENLTVNDYISYRYGYTYHQMTSLMVSNSGTGETTQVHDNIFWGTNRFLAIVNNHRGEDVFSCLQNNLFYWETDVKDYAPFRYTKPDNSKVYLDSLSEFTGDSNTASIHHVDENYENMSELQQLKNLLEAVSGIKK